MSLETPHPQLEPLPYHIEVRDFLKSNEHELWNWFASAQAQADHTENLRLELLKSTYRLDVESHPEIYQGVEEAKARLGLDIPVTIYQAQNSPQVNATLFFIPGEGHIVFSGPTLSLLDGSELKSVMGHELAHYFLWRRDEGDFLIADRLIHAAAQDPRASSSHEQTARRFQLYTEIFADRGALQVAGDATPVVASLVKIETGLTQVSAASYLKQAEEIFARKAASTEGLTHPEAFIRARAVSLWQEQREQASAQIAAMIEGSNSFNELDLMGQARFARQTRRLLEHFLRPKWFQTHATMGHAKLYFGDFRPAEAASESELSQFDLGDAKAREYFCYVLLDFVTADRDLDEMPLAAALEISRKLEMDGEFEKLVARELKMKVREVRKLKEQAAEMLSRAEACGE